MTTMSRFAWTEWLPATKSVQKYSDDESRDDHGRWTTGGDAGDNSDAADEARLANEGGPAPDEQDSGETDLVAQQLATLSMDAQQHLDTLVPEALKSADFSEVDGDSEAPDGWDALDGDKQNEIADSWMEHAQENGTPDDVYDEIRKDVIADLNRAGSDEQEAIATNAAKDIADAIRDNPTDPDWAAFTSATPLFAESGMPETHAQIDPESFVYDPDVTNTQGDAEIPLLDLDLVRTTGGQPLTADQRVAVEGAWERFYEGAWTAKLNDEMVSDDVSEKMSEAESEYYSHEWNNMSDSDKFDYAKANGFADENSESSDVTPGLPHYWTPFSTDDSPGEGDTDYQRTRAIARELAKLRTVELLKARDLIAHETDIRGEPIPPTEMVLRTEALAEELASSTWESWKGDSHNTIGMALQLAVAREFPGGVHQLTDAEVKQATRGADSLFGTRTAGEYATDGSSAPVPNSGMARLQAYVRAQWEASQYVLGKAGVHDVQTYRALMLPKSKLPDTTSTVRPVGDYNGWDNAFDKLDNLTLLRNGAQSATMTRDIANGWNGAGIKNVYGGQRVVLRVSAPKTSVLSLPVFGQNEQNEQEIVLMGVKDKWKWDAWKGKAPTFKSVPLTKALITNDAPTHWTINLGRIEITDGYWLDPVNFEVLPPEKQQKDGPPDEARDDHGRWTEGSGGSNGAEAASPRGGVIPEHRAKFTELKAKWARINNALLPYVDRPEAPEARAKLNELKEVVKEMYTLKADPGGLEGIGLPGGPRDVVIIGAGPGGLAASVMGGTDGLDTLLIDGNTQAGGQAKFSSRIENYPGFPIGTTGEHLANTLLDQAQRVGAETKLGERVTGIAYRESDGMKTLTLSNGETVEARAVIVAGGVEFRKMDFEGSDSHSVVYADGKKLAELGRGKNVVVVGGSNGAAQAALGAALTADHVALISRSAITKGMSDYQVSALRNSPKISIHEGDEISKLICDDNKNARTLITKNGKAIDCNALGIFIGGASNTAWLPKSITLAHGKVAVNHNLETTMPGVFAVGDIRDGSIGRIGAAVGDGQMAERNVWEYFNTLQAKKKA